MSRYFNLDDYETVAERITKFYNLYPDGRIITSLESSPENLDFCRYKTTIYRRQGDLVPAATGFATETRETELKKSKSGQEYEDINYRCHEENCESSSVGRALSNLGLSGSKRPTREEMQKASRPAPPVTPPAPEKPSNNGNGNSNKSALVQTVQVIDTPITSTIQKVELLLKRINQSENISVLKQLAREIQFLNPKLNQEQKVVLKNCYFASLKRHEDLAIAPAH